MPQSVWVKTGTLQWWCDWKPHKWVDVRVALEQFTGHDGARDSILFVYYMVHEEKKVLGGAGHGGWGCPEPRQASTRSLLTAVLACGDRVPLSGGQMCGGPTEPSPQSELLTGSRVSAEKPLTLPGLGFEPSQSESQVPLFSSKMEAGFCS